MFVVFIFIRQFECIQIILFCVFIVIITFFSSLELDRLPVCAVKRSNLLLHGLNSDERTEFLSDHSRPRQPGPVQIRWSTTGTWASRQPCTSSGTWSPTASTPSGRPATPTRARRTGRHGRSYAPRKAVSFHPELCFRVKASFIWVLTELCLFPVSGSGQNLHQHTALVCVNGYFHEKCVEINVHGRFGVVRTPTRRQISLFKVNVASQSSASSCDRIRFCSRLNRTRVRSRS